MSNRGINDIELRELITDPASQSGVGNVYVKQDGHLWYQEPNGTKHKITPLPTGGGGGTPLAIYDKWIEYWLSTSLNLIGTTFVGANIGGGNNGGIINQTNINGFYHYGVFIRSGTNANSGYRYNTNTQLGDFFGTISHKFQCIYMPMTAFTGRLVRLGYHDVISFTTPQDGVYFELNENQVICVTRNFPSVTSQTMTTTMNLGTNYHFDIEVNAAGTSAIFRLTNADTQTLLETITITTNIPTTADRGFGTAFVATEASTTASNIGILRFIGTGTIEGFNRARG